MHGRAGGGIVLEGSPFLYYCLSIMAAQFEFPHGPVRVPAAVPRFRSGPRNTSLLLSCARVAVSDD